MWQRAVLSSALVFSLAACGASRPPIVSEGEVARLPAEEKARVAEAMDGVTRARMNVETAKVALDDARRYQPMVKKELAASTSSAQAADEGMKLGRDTGSSRTVASSGDAKRRAEEQLEAHRAKLDYAKSIVALREAELAHAERAQDLAVRTAELEKARAMARQQGDTKVSVAQFATADEQAAQRLHDAEARVQELRTRSEATKAHWLDVRREFNIAEGEAEPMDAPAPPPSVTR
jgi:hypothetical protein